MYQFYSFAKLNIDVLPIPAFKMLFCQLLRLKCQDKMQKILMNLFQE
jgi:hypothetical protein